MRIYRHNFLPLSQSISFSVSFVRARARALSSSFSTHTHRDQGPKMFDMSHSYMCHDSCATWLVQCVIRLIRMCDATCLHVWRDSFICVTWLTKRSWKAGVKMPLYVCHDSFVCVTWIIHMCHVTCWNVWHDSFICVTWLIRMCDMTHSYVWRDSFICVTWLIHMCDMTHSYVWRDSFIYMWHDSCHTNIMSHAWTSHVTHKKESWHRSE